MRFTAIFSLLLISCGSGWGQGTTQRSAASTSLVLYDNFNGPKIDPAKWDSTAEVGRMLELLRDLSPSYQGEGNNRRLHIFSRSYSWNGSDQDVTWGRLGFTFHNPAPIKEVAFNVVANSAAVTSCSSNPSVASIGAQFRGLFFNTGSADVETVITLDRYATDDPKAPLTVAAYYYSQDGAASDGQILGYVPLGQTAKLHLTWSQPTQEFIFQLNSDAAVHMRYYIPDSLPPVTPYKGIQLTPGTANCATAPAASAVMDAYFDDVYVNAQ